MANKGKAKTAPRSTLRSGRSNDPYQPYKNHHNSETASYLARKPNENDEAATIAAIKAGHKLGSRRFHRRMKKLGIIIFIIATTILTVCIIRAMPIN